MINEHLRLEDTTTESVSRTQRIGHSVLRAAVSTLGAISGVFAVDTLGAEVNPFANYVTEGISGTLAIAAAVYIWKLIGPTAEQSVVRL